MYGIEGYTIGQDIQVEYFQDGATHDAFAHYNDTTKTLRFVDLDLIVGMPFAFRALPSTAFPTAWPEELVLATLS